MTWNSHLPGILDLETPTALLPKVSKPLIRKPKTGTLQTPRPVKHQRPPGSRGGGNSTKATQLGSSRRGSCGCQGSGFVSGVISLS